MHYTHYTLTLHIHLDIINIFNYFAPSYILWILWCVFFPLFFLFVCLPAASTHHHSAKVIIKYEIKLRNGAPFNKSILFTLSLNQYTRCYCQLNFVDVVTARTLSQCMSSSYRCCVQSSFCVDVILRHCWHFHVSAMIAA